MVSELPMTLMIALSALVIGIDVIMKYCKHLKYIKNIVMITDGNGATDWSEVDDIAQQINEQHINLSILQYLSISFLIFSGIDFDDPDFGFKEEDKPKTKVLLSQKEVAYTRRITRNISKD
jgi:ATP-dependent DNA helicase 2 subunit 2